MVGAVTIVGVAEAGVEVAVLLLLWSIVGVLGTTSRCSAELTIRLLIRGVEALNGFMLLLLEHTIRLKTIVAIPIIPELLPLHWWR